MPTRDNIAQLESLLEATTALVETKRVVDKVEYDIRLLKSRLGMRESQDAEGEAVTADAMEVDEGYDGGEGVGEDGRANSVVSTRSARSRKHVSSEIGCRTITLIVLYRLGDLYPFLLLILQGQLLREPALSGRREVEGGACTRYQDHMYFNICEIVSGSHCAIDRLQWVAYLGILQCY